MQVHSYAHLYVYMEARRGRTWGFLLYRFLPVLPEPCVLIFPARLETTKTSVALCLLPPALELEFAAMHGNAQLVPWVLESELQPS